MKSDRILRNLPGRPGSVEFSLTREEGMDWAVVIPVRNRPDLLEKCLDSLRKQQFPDGRWEVLICDDGSTVDLSSVVERFIPSLPDLRILRQPPKGPAAARNLGFRSSPAEIFVCLDSDVICAPGFLVFMIQALYDHPDWVAAEGAVLPTGKQGLLHDAPVNRGGSYGTGASAYRASALKQVGGLDEAFPYPACEDAELAARLLSIGKYGYAPEAIVYHPTRRINLRMLWHSRRYWLYVTVLAKRYGFLAFPGRSAGPFPRLRVALAAVLTLPGGRFLQAVRNLSTKPLDRGQAIFYALFDFICGVCALPEILFAPIPARKYYLSQ
jgi:GT2 family glycosyltransferase